MPTLDEIFAAMPDAAAEDTHEVLYIDPATRQIDVPDAEAILGVESDGKTERKYFACPRYVGAGIDLAACFLRVNYRNANNEVDAYLVEDAAVKGEYVTFSWEMTRKVTGYKGKVQFIVCAILPGSDSTYPEWNTTLASGEVLEGLEPDGAAAEAATADVIAQLLALVDRQAAAVTAEGNTQIAAVQKAAQAATSAAQEAVAAKGAATLATIPEDYTTLAGKVNNLANAVKGALRGEIVRADDVSQVEHYPAVRVRSKNLLNLDSYHLDSGGRYRIKADGLETGKTYTVFSDVPMVFFKLSDSYTGHNSAAVGNDAGFSSFPFTMARNENTPADAQLYFFINNAEKTAMYDLDELKAMNICIVEGDTATEYTPYIAPETVTVRKHGKNLLPYPYYNAKKTEHNGLIYTLNSDKSITVSGTSTAESYYVLTDWKPDDDWAVSGILGKKYALQDCVYNPNSGFMIYHSTGAVVNKTYRPQVELGTIQTAWEEPVETQYLTPLEDGTVGGLTSLAPTMTLLTDTAGVIVECEYNRDTGKVIQRLVAAIEALGGTV